MAYNRRNLLTKIVEIQELYTLKKVAEATHIGVYRQYILPKYHISLRTLNDYLAVPAKAELKKLDSAAAVSNNVTQFSLFNDPDDETDQNV